jgi:hypothetical protein
LLLKLGAVSSLVFLHRVMLKEPKLASKYFVRSRTGQQM